MNQFFQSPDAVAQGLISACGPERAYREALRACEAALSTRHVRLPFWKDVAALIRLEKVSDEGN